MPRRRVTSLTGSPEFQRIYRKGSVVRGRLFSVHALPNVSDEPRLGLSISKKVGTAVVRNKIRRRLKEIFRLAGDDLPGRLDLVISARPSAAEASFEDLREEFSRSLRRLSREDSSRGLDEAS